MTKNYILGMDIAQKSAVAQLDRADGSHCWRVTLNTDKAGWNQLEALFKSTGVCWSDTLALLEATGIYHLPWADRLYAAGADIHVLNPLMAAKLESTANALRGHKTDHVDVNRLCEAGRLYADQLSRFRYTPEPARQGLRQHASARVRLRAVLTNIKKSLKSHLELVFPAILAANLEADSARVAAILAVAPTAGAWLSLPQTQRLKLARDKCTDLDECSANTLADEVLAQACVPAMQALLVAQHALITQLKACDSKIAGELPAERVALITSLPGFGDLTAAVLTAYLPSSFEGWGTAKMVTARLQAYLGIDPRLRQSGKWKGKIKISKRGVRVARTALYQASFCSLARDPQTAAYYDSLRARGKTHKHAMIDVMRKQLRRLVSVLLSNQPYVSKCPLAA